MGRQFPSYTAEVKVVWNPIFSSNNLIILKSSKGHHHLLLNLQICNLKSKSVMKQRLLHYHFDGPGFQYVLVCFWFQNICVSRRIIFAVSGCSVGVRLMWVLQPTFTKITLWRRALECHWEICVICWSDIRDCKCILLCSEVIWNV
jgi:hypothetical protein